jgi:CelD/BcsL family acetyltransferase involved in cellulose biosynthesis
MQTYSVRLCSTAREFADLKNQWNRLFNRIEQPSPFLMHEWFMSCINAYGAGKELVVLAVIENNELIGLAPLWKYRQAIRRIPARFIGFIACPDTAFADMIVLPEKREDILQTILVYLQMTLKEAWDWTTLQQWSRDSPNLVALKQILLMQGKRHGTSVCSVLPRVHLSQDWLALLGSRSQKFRKTHRNITNRIARLDGVEMECLLQDKNGNLLETLVSLARNSWKFKEGISLANSPEAISFFGELIAKAGECGQLMVWLLKLNGKCIAMEIDVVSANRAYALRADYDEEFGSYSPGAYLQYEIVKALIEAKYEDYCTGPGASAYKLHWTDAVSTNESLHLPGPSMRGNLIWHLEESIVPSLRGMRSFFTREGRSISGSA